jgi:hypothetical protein
MTVYAEEVNYWKTGQSSPDTWIDNANREIAAIGGTVLNEGYGWEQASKRAAFLLEFTIGAERFRAVWPVLPVRSAKDERAASLAVYATALSIPKRAKAQSSQA